MNLRWLLLCCVLIGLLGAAGCGADPPPAAGDREGEGAQRFAVRVVTAESGRLEQVLETTAVARPERDSTLLAETPVRVVRRLFDVGDRVPAGRALLAVDDELLRAQLVQAREGVQQARDALALREHEWKGVEELYAQGRVSDLNRLQAKLGLSSASAAVAAAVAAETRAHEALRQGSMPAPFDGQVAAWYVVAGDRMAPGAPVARMVRLDPLLLRFGATERELGLLRTDQLVRARTRDGPGGLEGRVKTVSPAVDAAARTWQIEVEVANPDGRIKGGTVVQIEVVVGMTDEGVLLPTQAISVEDVPVVYVVAEGRAERRVVRLGVERDGRVAVLEGVRVGERVATTGREVLSDGALVDHP
jgi:membrane fusion protein (multidrug efflux system)